MACLLLSADMDFSLFKTLIGRFTTALFGLLSVTLVSFEAAGQTDATLASKTIDAMVVNKNIEAQFALKTLKSQPDLLKHIEKINHLRLLLKKQTIHSNLGTHELGQNRSVVISSNPTIERLEGTQANSDEAVTLAILELKHSIAARRARPTLFPGAGILLILGQISNFSERNMIKALQAGGTPIYSDVGHLIGVQHPKTKRLLGGRKS